MANVSDMEMLWFGLDGSTGQLVNLGLHQDFESASNYADDHKIDAVWLLDEYGAKSWANSILDVIKMQDLRDNA